jgi:hypothetical protein
MAAGTAWMAAGTADPGIAWMAAGTAEPDIAAAVGNSAVGTAAVGTEVEMAVPTPAAVRQSPAA